MNKEVTRFVLIGLVVPSYEPDSGAHILIVSSVTALQGTNCTKTLRLRRFFLLRTALLERYLRVAKFSGLPLKRHIALHSDQALIFCGKFARESIDCDAAIVDIHISHFSVSSVYCFWT